MTNSFKRKLLGSAVVAALPFLMASRAAACDGCVVSAVGAAAASIVTAIGVSQTAVVGTLGLVDQHITAALGGASAAIVAAVTESAKNQTTVLASTIAQDSMNKAVLRAQANIQGVDPCIQAVPAMGVANTAYTAPSRAAAYQRNGSASPVAFSGGNTAMNNAIAIAKGQVPPPAPEVQAQAAAQGACKSFAASGTLRGQTCQAAGVAPTDTSGLPNADVSATTLLDGPQASLNAADRVVRGTISSDPASADQLAVNAYLRNLDTPIQLRTLKPGELQTNAGQRYMAVLDTYDARMSMANAANVDQAAGITASTQTLPMINQLLASAQSSYVATFLNRANPNWKSQGISWNDMLNLEAQRRYLNPQWAAQLLQDGDAEVRRSIARQLAFQSYLMVQLLQEMRANRLTNSVTAMSMVRQEMQPQLVKVHELATR